MKNVILFTIFLCIVRLAAAQTRVTDVSQSSLKGKVKRIVTYTFRGDNDAPPDTTASAEKTIETFDEKGWALERKMYDKNGTLQERFSFEYVGDSIAMKNQFDGSGKLFFKYIFKYDGRGIETEFDMDGDAQPQLRLAKTDYRCIYKYDVLGNRVTEEQYSDHDKPIMKTTSQYNDQHQRMQSDEELFLAKGVKESKVIYTYDNSGNSVKFQSYDADGTLTEGYMVSHNNFDKCGNWLTETFSYSSQSANQGDFTFGHISKRQIEYY
jgi:hypothetical protein